MNFYQVTGTRLLRFHDRNPEINSFVLVACMTAVLMIVPTLLDSLIPSVHTTMLLFVFFMPYMFAAIVIYWRRFLGL